MRPPCRVRARSSVLILVVTASGDSRARMRWRSTKTTSRIVQGATKNSSTPVTKMNRPCQKPLVPTEK